MKRETEETRRSRRMSRFIFGIAVMLLVCIVVSVSEFHTAPRMPRQKIGLIMRGAKDQDGWNKVQYEGLRDAAKDLGMDVVVKENTLRSLDEYKKILDNFAAQGIQRVVITWRVQKNLG